MDYYPIIFAPCTLLAHLLLLFHLRWLDEMVRIQQNIRLGGRLQEWQETYSRLRQRLPSKYQLLHAKSDALSNRVLYSREPLQRFWKNTLEQLKGKRLWNVDPSPLAWSKSYSSPLLFSQPSAPPPGRDSFVCSRTHGFVDEMRFTIDSRSLKGLSRA